MLIISFFVSCETDFEVNDEWKEIGVVYCLLDKEDSFQYVRLQKAYLNTNTNAYQLAQLNDSIYYTQEVKVQLIHERLKDTINLEPYSIENKADGVFSSTPYFVYRTPPGLQLQKNNIYILRVKNTETGYELTASAPVIEQGNVTDPTAKTTSLAYCSSLGEFRNYIKRREMTINSGRGVKFYDMSILFHYGVIDSNNITDTTWESIEWEIGKMVSLSSTKGSLPAQLTYSGEDFFRFIGRQMKPQPAGKAIVPGFLEYLYMAGGQDIFDYINVNRPSNGIVQKNPEYTNVTNGLGIFSSRTDIRRRVGLDGCTIDRLAVDPFTSHLGFVR
ncbi:MAG: hypothetical protein KDC92_11720 [Bacteroidetes bacterium]|nr:hypothetical protein [Bacteroidota bacterium]